MLYANELYSILSFVDLPDEPNNKMLTNFTLFLAIPG